jgi:hypothetical protein
MDLQPVSKSELQATEGGGAVGYAVGAIIGFSLAGPLGVVAAGVLAGAAAGTGDRLTGGGHDSSPPPEHPALQ